MFDQPDDDFDIPRCALCPYELHGADYSRLTCRRCEDRLYTQLGDVEHLWDRLPPATFRRTGAPSVGRGMRVHSAIPGNANVINLTGPGAETPAGRLLCVEDDWRLARRLQPRPRTGRPGATLRTAARFLRGHLPWACGPHLNPPVLPDGSALLPDVQLLDEALGQAVSSLRGVVEQASSGEPRPRTVAVVCGVVFSDGSACEAAIRVGAGDTRRLCPGCGFEWRREEYLRMADAVGYFGEAA